MTKEEWLIEREKLEFSLRTFYDYYTEIAKPLMTFEEFEQLFPIYIVNHSQMPTVGTDGLPKLFKMDSCIARISDYFNKKFELI
jgi:hypothetical protein